MIHTSTFYDSWTSNYRTRDTSGGRWVAFYKIENCLVWLKEFSWPVFADCPLHLVSLRPLTMDYNSLALETRAVGGGWRSNVLTRRYRSIRSRSQLISGQGWIYLIALLCFLYISYFGFVMKNKYEEQNEQNKTHPISGQGWIGEQTQVQDKVKWK